LTSLPVSIALPGMIRPIQERTGIFSLTGGVIDCVYVREGQALKAFDLVASIKDFERNNQFALIEYEIAWRIDYINDLKILCNKETLLSSFNHLKHPALKQQHSRFIHSDQELVFSLNKAKKELDIAVHLTKEKVIAPKELFDKETEFNRLSAAREAFLSGQAIFWEQELAFKQQELKKLVSQHLQLVENEYQYKIKAPIAGIIQGVQTLYKGSVIQPGQLIGTISPEAELIAECFASPRNVGLLIPGQEVRFQIDAFDYKYFGILIGKIISIDNDYSLVDYKPIYKIRCSFEKSQVRLNNGYTGQLKKGMTLIARCTITERTLWQLLWDNWDDWLNPKNNLFVE